MATLIGSGSHATDIAHTFRFSQYVAHHTDYIPDFRSVVIGINDPWKRAEIAEEIGVEDSVWIHPDAYIGPECTWGPGTHINYAVSMTRTQIGRHCTISPGVTICGDVIIGDRVLIGAGATICDRVTINNDVTVGAGAVILPETTLEAACTYVGVPARCL